MKRKTRDFDLKIKSVSETGEFSGYASVFGVEDGYGDVVVKGAFVKSLKNWETKGRKPALLWQHKTDEPIGIYTEMREDDIGLYVEGKLLIDTDELALRAHSHMKAGSISGLSIGFNLVDYEYDQEKSVFLLKEIDLWEVSLVTFPANDESRIIDVKTILKDGATPPPSLVERSLRDAGLSRKQAKAIMAKGYEALRDADKPEKTDVQSIKSILSNAINL